MSLDAPEEGGGLKEICQVDEEGTGISHDYYNELCPFALAWLSGREWKSIVEDLATHSPLQTYEERYPRTSFAYPTDRGVLEHIQQINRLIGEINAAARTRTLTAAEFATLHNQIVDIIFGEGKGRRKHLSVE